MNCFKNIFFLTVAIISLIVGSAFSEAVDSGFQEVKMSELPATLDMMIAVSKNNYDRIISWQCDIAQEDVLVLRDEDAALELKDAAGVKPAKNPREIHRKSKCNNEVKINTQKNLFLSRMNCPEPFALLDPKTEKVYTSKKSPTPIIEISTPEYQVEIRPQANTKGQTAPKQIARKEKLNPARRSDPRTAFYVDQKPVWIMLSDLSKSLQTAKGKTKGIVFKKKFIGREFIYRIEIPQFGKDQSSLVFELSRMASFNPILIEKRNAKNGFLIYRYSAEFVNYRAVILPKKYTLSRFHPDDGKLINKEVREIKNNMLNRSISDDIFSELNYLQDGDEYIDEIKNKKYIQKAGKLEEVYR